MFRSTALPLAFAAALPALFIPQQVLAQESRPLLAVPQVRITAPVSGSAMVTLKGNTSPRALAKYDGGAVNSSLATGRLRLLLKRSPAQDTALTQFMGGLQDPNSPNYRKWLSPAEFGASFGVADADIQTIEAWLESNGFKIEGVPASRNSIVFSGTMGEVAQAFHTNIHSYSINGVQHLSNAADPQIPAALAPVVAGVSPLNDFRAKPLHVLGGRGQLQSVKGQPSGTQTGRSASPLLTETVDSNSFFYVTPSDAATIYDAPNSLNRNFTSGTPRTGAGVNIGLVGDSDLKTADYQNFVNLFLSGQNTPSPRLVVDGADPGVVNGGNAEEALLDAELAQGAAPGAQIYFYSGANDLLESGPLDAALRAVEDNQVSILSVSFGLCESNLGASGNQQLSETWRQAAAQGITVVVSSGDTGSAGCDSGDATQATGGLAVSGFASTPYNVAVGGTDFDALSLTNGFTQYLGATYGFFGTALGYIPENPWNDSISNNPPGQITTNTAAQYRDANGNAFTVIDAGSGGPSSAGVCNGIVDGNGNCSVALTGYARPSFQSSLSLADTSIPSGVRLIPDVSLFAAPGSQHRAGWAFCADSDVAQASTTYTDCQATAASGSPEVSDIGGTSASAPTFAGILADVIASLPGTPRLGLANNVIYNLAATHASVFHDVTAGNISVPCQASSTNCTVSSQGTNFLSGWNATAGYDLATGLGSVDIAQLIAAWPSVVFTPTTTTLQANGGTSAISFQHGTALSLGVNVSPANATGDVSITATATGQGGLATTQLIPLVSGSGTLSPVTTLPGGSYTLQAYYQGDATHAPSTSSTGIPVTISPEASSPFLSLAATDLADTSGRIVPNPTSITYGEYGFAYVQPENANALNSGVGSHGSATGTATLQNNGSTVGTQSLNSQGEAAFPLYSLAPGTYSFAAQYSGDSSYNSSSTTASLPLTISKGATSLAVHVGTGATTGNSRTITVELDTDSAGSAPSGAVVLTLNGSTYNSTSVQNGAISTGAVALFASFSVPASSITSSNRFSATYPGDTNYNSSTAATCSYTPSSTSSVQPRRGLLFATEGGAAALCAVLLFGIPARRRAWRAMLGLLLMVGVMGAVGCGSSSSSSGSNTTTIVAACAQ